jgi:hypothetical protein
MRPAASIGPIGVRGGGGPYLWRMMALFLINRLAALTGFGIVLAGCCANNVCDCPNEADADAIRIVFDSKFTADELDTLSLVRYLRPDPKNSSAPLPKPETVTLIRTAAQIAANDTVVINNATPFSQLGSARLDAFSYVLRYYPNSKPKVRPSKLALVIDSVKLSGSFEGNGCCTCYTNSRKEAFARFDSTKTPGYSNLKLREAVLTVTR